MDYFELLIHKVHLEKEIKHLESMLQEHDTGHIATAISVLEFRVNEILKQIEEI
jgi:hypothetical protein